MRNQITFLLETATRVCVALVLFLSPFSYRTTLVERRIGEVYSSYTDFFYHPADFFLIGAFAFGLLALVVGARKFKRGPWWLTYPLCALIVLSWIGVLTGVDRELTAYHSLRLTLLLGFYFVLVNVRIAPVWIALALVAGVLTQGTVAIGQFVQQHSIGLQQYGELPLDPLESGTSIVRDDPLRVLRAYGLTDHPNLLGGFLSFALILILGYYFAAAHTRARYLLLLPLAIGAVALVFTFSRAAWLALAAGIVFLSVCLWWSPRERRARVVPYAVAFLVLISALILPSYTNRSLIALRAGQSESFTENVAEERSLTERDLLIASATRLFVKHAVTGVGNGALPTAMFLLDREFDTRYYYQPAHIVLLEVAVELGMFGGIVWLWLMVAPWLALYAQRRVLFESAWRAALAGALLALTVIGFLDYYPWLLPPGRIWQWSVFGLLGAFFAQTPERSASQE